MKSIVRARAPLRLGLAGGGTDLSPYCDQFGGTVLNSTIAKFAHVTITFKGGDVHSFTSRDMNTSIEMHSDEMLGSGKTDPRFALVVQTLRRVVREQLGGKIPALHISTAIDAPMGSGLGSSSALVVAIVEALTLAFELPLGQYEIAKLAWEIERLELGLEGGKQDQYAAAFGGLNYMEFLEANRVIVNPIRLHPSKIFELESSLLIAYTGISRRSDLIIRDQVKSTSDSASNALDGLHQIKKDAQALKAALLKWNPSDIAGVLNRSWLAKKNTSSSMSTPEIDHIYEVAMESGALGGKISGAGGGGFFMFFVNPERREIVFDALLKTGAKPEYVKFYDSGAHAWRASAN